MKQNISIVYNFTGSDCILHGYIKKLGGPFASAWQTRYAKLYPNRLELHPESATKPELVFLDQVIHNFQNIIIIILVKTFISVNFIVKHKPPKISHKLIWNVIIMFKQYIQFSERKFWLVIIWNCAIVAVEWIVITIVCFR